MDTRKERRTTQNLYSYTSDLQLSIYSSRAEPMRIEKVMIRAKAKMGPRMAQITSANSRARPAILAFVTACGVSLQLTLSSISRSIRYSDLHSGGWLSGESRPSFIHEGRPLVGVLTFHTNFKLNSLIGILLQLRECTPNDIDRFLIISKGGVEVKQIKVTYLAISTQDTENVGPLSRDWPLGNEGVCDISQAV